MEILTVDKIRKFMQEKGRRPVCDGWLTDARITWESKSPCLSTMHYDNNYELKCEFKFEQRAVCKEGLVSNTLDEMAHRLHRELYGGITRKLAELEYIIKNAHRSEAEAFIKNLIGEIVSPLRSSDSSGCG